MMKSVTNFKIFLSFVKTVNISQWVNSRAEDLKINFSKTLEEALLEKIYK